MFLYLKEKKKTSFNNTNEVMSQMYPFLKSLAENNKREWFEENRDWYERAKTDAEALVESCIFEIGRFEDLGDLKPKQAMFRIHRDVRFSKNKDPFKSSFSAMISRDGKRSMTSFAYYLHFQPGETFVAAGVYEPTSEQLAKIRQEIDYNADDLKKIIEAPEFVNRFGTLLGAQLKTAPKGFPKDHPEIDLLRYNQFYFSTPFREEEVLSASFPKNLAEVCKQIRPFLEFMNRALD